MKVFNWIKSFFVNPTNYDSSTEGISSIEPPYSLLYEVSLTIDQIKDIQNIIEKYGNDNNSDNPNTNEVQKAYDELISISTLDENLRLYLHEMMLFTSIRMTKADFFVDVSRLIISNYPHLLNFVESQIFWCFENNADLFVYKSIERNLLCEESLDAFRNSLLNEMEFYEGTDSSYNPIFRYLRFKYLLKTDKSDCRQSFFQNYFIKNEHFLKDPDYQVKMRCCMNNDPIAVAIRNDEFELIGPDNGHFENNIIERNEILSFGCSYLMYAAFYGSFKCFQKIYSKYKYDVYCKREKVALYDEYQYKYYPDKMVLSLSDFAACGGNLELCKFVLKIGVQFTSQSLKLAIKYHRVDVFEYLTNDLNISMTEECYKTSLRYEFIPGIELYKGNKNINVNFEVSKSGNYVLFSNFFNLNKIYMNGNYPVYKYKYAPLMPIFLFNSVDCYRFIMSKKIDLNECSWFDERYGSCRSIHIHVDEFNKYRNPLHVAIDHQFLDLVKMILKFCVIDVNKYECLLTRGGVGTFCYGKNFQLPPLEIAIKTNNPKIVEFLLLLDEINVNDPSYKNGGAGHGGSRNNLSIILSAIEHGNLEILEMLLKSPRIDKQKINHSKTFGNHDFQNTEEYYISSKYAGNQDVIKLLARYGIK